jgi:hypothetical protein
MVRNSRSKRQRGEGTGTIILYVALFSVASFVFYAVTGWIYETKEARAGRGPDQPKRFVPSERPYREPAGYLVVCNRADCQPAGFPLDMYGEFEDYYNE